MLVYPTMKVLALICFFAYVYAQVCEAVHAFEHVEDTG